MWKDKQGNGIEKRKTRKRKNEASKMTKDKVIIEEMDESKVGVYLYDEFTNSCMNTPIEVCHLAVAHEKYKVVGEMLPEGPAMFDSEGDEEDGDYTLEDFNLAVEDDD